MGKTEETTLLQEAVSRTTADFDGVGSAEDTRGKLVARGIDPEDLDKVLVDVTVSMARFLVSGVVDPMTALAASTMAGILIGFEAGKIASEQAQA